MLYNSINLKYFIFYNKIRCVKILLINLLIFICGIALLNNKILHKRSAVLINLNNILINNSFEFILIDVRINYFKLNRLIAKKINIIINRFKLNS